jgi:putative transcriptional regulator
MANASKRPSLFERLKTGLQEGIGFAREELSLRTTEVPDRPPAFPAAKVMRLRRRLRMSQGVFARMLNVSPKTVQSWEQGERQPSQAALRLLQILGARPGVVCAIVGLRTIAAKNKKKIGADRLRHR